MFGSNLLDVAIGMIFVYLLLSLICSAAHEIIEGWLKNRATDLERGIRELLDPNSKVSEESIVKHLYKHPLINGLYKGTYEEFANYRSKFFLWRWLVRFFTTWPKLPSYVPARNFALALMDTVLPANSSAGATSPPASDSPSGAAGATPPGPHDKAPLVVVNPAATSPMLSPPAPNPLQPLREAISQLPYEPTRRALLAIVDAAGNDAGKARENIENWFNSSMDRVSGWYKRRSQIIILALGFIVAIALNADSVTLVKRLWTDKALRDSLVAVAEVYAKENPNTNGNANANSNANSNPKENSNANAKDNANVSARAHASSKTNPDLTTATTAQDSNTSPPPSTQSLTPSPNISAAAPSRSPTPSPATSPSHSPSGGTAASSSPTPTPSPATLPECVKDENSPECKLAKNRQEIKSLGLPLGWADPKEDPTAGLERRWPGNHWKRAGGWWDQLYWHLLGWLITALAISLGAPFWFDLLNKFIVIRSTVKPHEKSPEEGSKE